MQDILKNRILHLAGGIIILIFIVSCGTGINQKPRVLLITGGHSYDTSEFFTLFESFDEYHIDTLSQPAANLFIGSGKAEKYDILVFYDYWQQISEAEKEAYLELTKQGKGFLFLHHSLVSYLSWEDFSKIRGGKYPKSNPPDTINDGRYRHDIDIQIQIQDTTHFITKGMNDFTIHDEGYSNVIFFEGITPLLKTNHPDCAENFAWTNQYNNSKVVYLMGGHDKQAYVNESYQDLIKNSLAYLSGK